MLFQPNKVRFILTGLPRDLVLSSSPITLKYAFVISVISIVYMKCLGHVFLIEFLTLIIFGEECKMPASLQEILLTRVINY